MGADRAYASEPVRAPIEAAGKEAVIPPRANRSNPPGYDKQKHNARNKVQRLFDRLRRLPCGGHPLPTKLASMFLGGVLATLLAVSLKRIVNTPWLAIFRVCRVSSSSARTTRQNAHPSLTTSVAGLTLWCLQIVSTASSQQFLPDIITDG